MRHRFAVVALNWESTLGVNSASGTALHLHQDHACFATMSHTFHIHLLNISPAWALLFSYEVRAPRRAKVSTVLGKYCYIYDAWKCI